MFNFSCCFISVFTFSSNSATIFFIFSKPFFLSQLLYSIVNLFHYTKYFITSLIFLLFSFFTFHSLTPFTSISFSFSTFYPSTCSLYCTTQLTFITRSILIEVGNCYGHSNTNNFYFILFYFFWFYFSFSFLLFYFPGKTMKKACDKDVTWHVTWCDVTSLEHGRMVWKMTLGHREYT